MNHTQTIGVLGATSHVGQALLPMLIERGYAPLAFTRQAITPDSENPRWQHLSAIDQFSQKQAIPYWITLSPIALLEPYFKAFEASGTKRIVALSSTSIFTKSESTDPADQRLAQTFLEAEQNLQKWAEKVGIEYVILRPTLIYGLGKDKNICEIMRLIRRFGFFPLLGEAKGLRQPVHCRDVAQACVSALTSSNAANHSYNLSGSEVLSYKAMVLKLFQAMGQKPRLVSIPIGLLKMSITLLKLIPRYRSWSFAMVERTNQDMIFDHDAAGRDLNFKPQAFELSSNDLP